MKVLLERLPESRIQLDIEVDDERLQPHIETAYRRLANRVRIPGFRPGKAPRPLIERQIGGRPGLIREALDDVFIDVYNAAIEQENVEAVGQPTLDKIDMEPLRFTATVPVRPTVTLGDYTSIRVERSHPEVTQETVDEQILLLRRRHATLVPVERGAAWNDHLTADITGTVDGQPFLEDRDAEFTLREGEVLFIPGLAEAFLGLAKAQDKELELTIPDDFRTEIHRGKQLAISLHLREVKEEQLPDLDDEFAALVNADQYESYEAMVADIRKHLQEHLDSQAKDEARSAAIDQLVAAATIDYPRVLVDREIDTIIQGTTGGDRQAYANYLQRVGRSEDEFRETFREVAEDRVRRALAISELARAENVEVSAGEVAAEIDRMAGSLGDPESTERFRQLFASGERQGSVRANLLTARALERLDAIAAGETVSSGAASAPPTEEETL